MGPHSEDPWRGRSSVRPAIQAWLVTLLHVLDDPEGFPRRPSSHGDVVLRGSAGGEGVHRRGVAQSLALRNCKRSVQVKNAPPGKCENDTWFPKCSMAPSPGALPWWSSKHQMDNLGGPKLLRKKGTCWFFSLLSEKDSKAIVSSKTEGNSNITEPS